jgi:hypothetical protein
MLANVNQVVALECRERNNDRVMSAVFPEPRNLDRLGKRDARRGFMA